MKKIYFDRRKCLGCHSCEFVCAVEHSRSKDPLWAHLEEETPIPRRNVRLVEGMCLTLSCRHCEPAPCVEACIAGAMQKSEGEVRCDTQRCIGCWMCVMVCPFGAAKPGRIYAIKCDMCSDRKGLSYACVEGCPSGALFVASEEEFAKILKENREVSPARSGS
jgi:carbon-monoxide dehydrogenase iron sulfur subunit